MMQGSFFAIIKFVCGPLFVSLPFGNIKIL